MRQFKAEVQHLVNGIIDKILLIVPVSVLVAIVYFVRIWTLRQTDAKRVARAEIIFWSSTLTILVLLATYSTFFRRPY